MGVEAWLLVGAGARLTSEPTSVVTENSQHAGLRLDGGHNVNLDLRGSSITGFYLELNILTQNLKLVTCS